ncbi:MAG: DNA-binding protein [Bacteroidales bacterium]|nr:DNA-binding protein [Bacteroidales bacterium]HOO67467.1 BACON domain-containing carbohydrate-binding protein [Bacteroidales bacterium]HPJ05685.1 BACON domain-containing carbohydrate-binding protein [Bacteroidales bacterium]
MKLKYFFPLIIAAVALTVSCDDEFSATLLDEIQVSSSYVSIPLTGGSTSITVTANDAWTVENSLQWLTISSTSGSAGESTLTFSAESALDGRKGEIQIQCGGVTQRINVIQGLATVAPATCAEVIAGPDSKTYLVTGVCTAITNTTYGNWYLEDETGSIYIYGTLDAKGGTKNFLSWGLEVGDEVTVQGPKTTYQGTVELVDVTVININKSLIKVDSVENAVLPSDGGEFIAYLTCKGQGVSVDIPEDAESWLSISSIQSAETSAVVKFQAEANSGEVRETTITFHTTDGTKDYTSQTELSQLGAIIDASIEEFLAAEVSDKLYRLEGVITDISNTTYGNLDIRDFSGEAYVYGIEDFSTLGLKEGDIITIVGKRAAYHDNPQVGDAFLESSISVTAATIAEVLAKPDDPNTYFMVTGEISRIASGDYGNLDLKDGDDVIYSYGCYPGWGATGDDRKFLVADLGLKVGDQLTVIAPKGSYQGSPQLVNSIYFSHVSSK